MDVHRIGGPSSSPRSYCSDAPLAAASASAAWESSSCGQAGISTWLRLRHRWPARQDQSSPACCPKPSPAYRLPAQARPASCGLVCKRGALRARMGPVSRRHARCGHPYGGLRQFGLRLPNASFQIAEMGFADKRDGTPDTAWVTLRTLAEAQGTLHNARSIGTHWAKVEKRIQKIRQRLRQLHPAKDDPLPFKKEGHFKGAVSGYEARFRISCAPAYHS